MALHKNLQPAVPVIYYHSVGNHDKSVPWSFLSYPIEFFEAQIKFMHKHRYQTISMGELYNYMKSGKSIPEKSVVIHFDDGFLDNWVFAFPILKKYNMKATIYVNPEFVEDSSQIRPTLEDIWEGKLDITDLNWWGYLSWKEMRLMEKSGLIDIQSHALTHTWYFSGNKIIDFHHPGDSYYWLFWNKYPEKKPTWFADHKKYIFDLGRPIYDHGKALTVRKFYEDKKLYEMLTSHVRNKGDGKYFNNPSWKSELFDIVENFKKGHTLNESFETEQEYNKRIKHELSMSKKLIEKNLNKTIDFLCWPGGGQNDLTFKLAYEVGYLVTTKGTELNKFGNYPKKISRVAAGRPLKLPIFQKWFDLLFLRFQLSRGRGCYISRLIGKVLKSFFLS